MRPVAFQTALMYGYAPARRAVFLGFYFNLVGKRSVDNPRPLVGDGLSIRSAQGRVWSTQEPAEPAVHTLVVWTAGLSTRGVHLDAAWALAVLLFCFFIQLPAGAAGGPRLSPCTHGSTLSGAAGLVKASRSGELAPHAGLLSCIALAISYRIDV